MGKVFQSRYFFISSLILLHALFFLYAVRSEKIYIPNDSAEYVTLAYNLSHHHTWYSGNLNEPVHDYYYSHVAPLTGFFIMLVKFFYNSDYAVCFAQCLLSIFNFLIAIKCIRLFYPSRKYDSLLAVLLLFFPSQLIYANVIMAEMLFQTLLLLTFYFAIKYFRNQAGKDFFLLNLFLVLTVLTKPVLYLFYIPHIIFFTWWLMKRKISLLTFSFVLMLPAVVLLVSVRNYRLSHVFQYSSVHEVHVTNYAVRNSVQFEKGRAFADSLVNSITQTAAEKNSYKEYHQYLMEKNYETLWQYKTAFIILSIKGFMQFFIDAGRWDIQSFFYNNPPAENPTGIYTHFKQDGITGAVNYLSSFSWKLLIYLLLCMVVNLFVFIMFIYFLLNPSINAPIKIFAFLIVMYIAVVTGMMGSARYRVEVYPLLLFAFPFGYEKLKERLKGMWSGRRKLPTRTSS